LLDLATGMQSKVPPELANRNISVKFSGLSVDDGIRKIFQGLPFDYVTVAGQGVIVTAASQAGTVAEAPAAYNPPMQAQQPPQQPIDQPFNQDFPPVGQPGMLNIPGQPVQINQPQQQPAMIQTPFGPIANPRAGQPAQPAAPVTQQNPLFPASPAQQPASGVIGAQQAAPTPFGTPVPFGSQQSNPNSVTPLFGSPSVFGSSNGSQPRQ